MEEDYFNLPPAPQIPQFALGEQDITNIVAQIDPKTIIDNLDHSLKGEFYDKENNTWIMNRTGKPLVNDACRGFCIGFLNTFLTNNTTMAHIDEKRLGLIMEGVITTINRNFTTRLEEFGFVPKSPTYNKGIYQNKGSPDSSKMDMVTTAIYSICFLVLTRPLHGDESKRIFKSLSMSDSMGYTNMNQQQQQKGWLSKLFGRK